MGATAWFAPSSYIPISSQSSSFVSSQILTYNHLLLRYCIALLAVLFDSNSWILFGSIFSLALDILRCHLLQKYSSVPVWFQEQWKATLVSASHWLLDLWTATYKISNILKYVFVFKNCSVKSVSLHLKWLWNDFPTSIFKPYKDVQIFFCLTQ